MPGTCEGVLAEGWTVWCHNIFVFPALCQRKRCQIGTDIFVHVFGHVGKTGWNPQCRGASKWCLSGRQKEWEPQWPVYMSLCGGGCVLSRCCVTVLAEIETPHPARGAPLAGSHRSQCHNLTCLRPEAGQQTVLGTGCCTTIEALGWVSFYLPLGWNHIPCPVFAAKSLRQYNSRISRLSWQTVFL